MNWFANFYFRDGPGIDKNAPKPEGLRLLAAVLGREWWTLIKLNLLFVAFSLPLVTVPAAWYATVKLSETMLEDRNIWLFRDFWAAFRSRFWLTTFVGFAFASGGALSALAVSSYAQAALDTLLFATPLTVAIVVSVALPLYAMHLLVALARADDMPLRTVLKIATIGLITKPLAGLGALVVVGLIWLAHVSLYPASVLMPVLFAFSLSALLLTFAVRSGVQFGFSHIAEHPHDGNPGSPETQSA